MRQITLFTATLAALLTLAAPARADMVDDCEQSDDLDRRISGCTALILSGQLSVRDLVIVYNRRGVAYYDLGEYRQAIEDYDQALRLDPGYAKAYYNRGNAYGRRGEYRRAIEDFDQALRLDPGLALGYYNRGNAYSALGEHTQAIEDFDEALRLDPGNANAYYNRGVAYHELGEHARAIEDYDRALRLDPGAATTAACGAEPSANFQQPPC